MDYETLKASIENNYKVVNYNKGHSKTVGVHANIRKNPFWNVLDEHNQERIIMYCETRSVCKLCPISFQKIIEFEKEHDVKITWFMAANGYIVGSNKLSMHQIIMNCYGNGHGTGTISVDHIDRDKLNNCYNNLRLATFEEQHQNCKGMLPGTKRERKHNARPLPDGISQDMLKKYVVYYDDFADKDKKRPRQYFKIEKHPMQTSPWIGCKSSKVSIIQKLAEANANVNELDTHIVAS